MGKQEFSVDTVNTSYGIEYHITDNEGTIYMWTYNKVAARICVDALNERYFGKRYFGKM